VKRTFNSAAISGLVYVLALSNVISAARQVSVSTSTIAGSIMGPAGTGSPACKADSGASNRTMQYWRKLFVTYIGDFSGMDDLQGSV
jgi:hypothetical protein